MTFFEETLAIQRCGHMVRSYRQLFGRPLLRQTFKSNANLAQALYDAPFYIISHDNQNDPVFWFASQMALRLWGRTAAEFIGMPSRLSAEADAQQDRDALVAQVLAHGYVTGYRGVRIGKDGNRFEILNVTMWNVSDENNVRIGQAAMFRDIRMLPRQV